jgi:hypothetical protein
MPLGFDSGAWLWVAAAAFALGHLLVLAYFLRGAGRPSGPSRGSPPDLPAGTEPGRPTDASADHAGVGRGDRGSSGELPPIESERVVQCPHCGVENAAEFRFCRYCVGELSGGTTVADATGASRDGQAF